MKLISYQMATMSSRINQAYKLKYYKISFTSIHIFTNTDTKFRTWALELTWVSGFLSLARASGKVLDTPVALLRTSVDILFQSWSPESPRWNHQPRWRIDNELRDKNIHVTLLFWLFIYNHYVKFGYLYITNLWSLVI